jgi:hypothetical protein
MFDRWTLEQLVGYIRTWSATTGYRQARREDPTIELHRQLLEPWGDPEAPRRVSWPLAVRVSRLPP